MVWALYIGAGVIGAFVSNYADRRHPWWAQWWYAAWMAFVAFVNGVSWWRHRKNRKRKRAASLVGAKSRARIEALVRKTREAAQPRKPAIERS